MIFICMKCEFDMEMHIGRIQLIHLDGPTPNSSTKRHAEDPTYTLTSGNLPCSDQKRDKLRKVYSKQTTPGPVPYHRNADTNVGIPLKSSLNQNPIKNEKSKLSDYTAAANVAVV